MAIDSLCQMPNPQKRSEILYPERMRQKNIHAFLSAFFNLPCEHTKRCSNQVIMHWEQIDLNQAQSELQVKKHINAAIFASCGAGLRLVMPWEFSG